MSLQQHHDIHRASYVSRRRSAASPHTSHAMILHLQEYRDRVQNACKTTYQFPLAPPKKPEPSARASKGYCRAHIMHTNKQFFDPPTSAPVLRFTPVAVKDKVMPKKGEIYINFHQMKARKGEFLYGDHQDRPRVLGDSAVNNGKDHFALGPGQYDMSARPHTTGGGGAAKFSPSDRFHEDFSTDHLGPGHYDCADVLTTTRPVSAVFSQMPRETDMAHVTSPTANIVSSYYYVAPSAFGESKSSRHESTRGMSWSRTPRFRGRQSHQRQQQQQQAPVVNYIERNIQRVVQTNTSQKTKWRQALWNGGGELPVEVPDTTTAFKRRASLFMPEDGLQRAARERVQQAVQGWTTVTMIASFQLRLLEYLHLITLVRRTKEAHERKIKQVVFHEWRKLDDARNRHYCAHLIVRNSLRFRIRLRIARKTLHVHILRMFLNGLSFDVRFAISMRKIKRKIQLIQRWWRHVHLMVRAREEALFHKWLTVENRLRLEYINQMPHLHRIFQPPTPSIVAGGISSAASSTSSSFLASSHNSELQLHKLLNLPDQKRWFTARFVLLGDGSLRGYDPDTNEILVEVKHFRCHYHDVATQQGDDLDGTAAMTMDSVANPSFQGYNTYTSSAWKPFLMVFRQGAFRFILLTSPSQLPTELLSWREKIERLVTPPTPTGPGSHNMHAILDGSFNSSVGELVEVSMQSGILASTSMHHVLLPDGSSANLLASGGSSTASLRGGSPPRSRAQSRLRSIRQRTKTGLSVYEGVLTYHVVDLLKDFPKVPAVVIWQTIRDRLREKRKHFRAEIYRYKLEMYHFHQHQEQVKHIQVLDKFRDFFTLERPKRPHFRSLISNRKMESMIRQVAIAFCTVEQVRLSCPSNPRYLLETPKV
ncbi:TPA: hypothetical protein N0F65_001762 [Lagenidium giganteum]|uniref:Uncharacterized protein n=1 Tax=Lagenidium giganteum TaxID=4803 RepID=A0AAV2Z4Z4_9STRA|nr:TPA: hypothetical protein N0F65_001762 [Lagenidium giganteum]